MCEDDIKNDDNIDINDAANVEGEIPIMERAEYIPTHLWNGS